MNEFIETTQVINGVREDHNLLLKKKKEKQCCKFAHKGYQQIEWLQCQLGSITIIQKYEKKLQEYQIYKKKHTKKNNRL